MAKKASPIKDPMTKSQVFAEIAETVGITKKEVAAVFDELTDLIQRHIKKNGCGQFTLPGLLKIKTVKRPARKAQKGVPNPFRPGELMDVAAKPATTRVKVAPLKKMKDFAA
jgi:nucleoid DNA-binding protein